MTTTMTSERTGVDISAHIYMLDIVHAHVENANKTVDWQPSLRAFEKAFRSHLEQKMFTRPGTRVWVVAILSDEPHHIVVCSPRGWQDGERVKYDVKCWLEEFIKESNGSWIVMR